MLSTPLYVALTVLVVCIAAVSSWRHRSRHSLHGRTVLISGCDSGIGRAAALHLFKRGATVFAGCLTAQGRSALQREADVIAESLRSDKTQPQLTAISLDVTSEESIAAAVAVVRASPHCAHGLDVLLNNAGVMAPASLVELTPLSSYRRNLDVNFLGPAALTKAALPLLQRKAQRGPSGSSSGPRVVTVTSFLGMVSPFSLSAYAASKFALEGFTQALRAELRSQGVAVVTIQPGSTRTGLGDSMRQGMNECWQGAGEATQARLGPSYLRAITRSSWLFDLFARDVSNVLPEVEHAVCARWPKNRYICGWDSLLFGQLLPILPAWVCDLGCLIVLGWPRPAPAADAAAHGNGEGQPAQAATGKQAQH